MSETKTTTAAAGSQDALVRRISGYRYRLHPVPVRNGGDIRCGFCIQVRQAGSRSWNRMVAVGDKPLLYYNEATASRHCEWLNDPKGTEPQWGVDDAPNAAVSDGGTPFAPRPGSASLQPKKT